MNENDITDTVLDRICLNILMVKHVECVRIQSVWNCVNEIYLYGIMVSARYFVHINKQFG